jgi:hypothetical protein
VSAHSESAATYSGEVIPCFPPPRTNEGHADCKCLSIAQKNFSAIGYKGGKPILRYTGNVGVRGVAVGRDTIEAICPLVRDIYNCGVLNSKIHYVATTIEKVIAPRIDIIRATGVDPGMTWKGQQLPPDYQ